MAYENLSKNDPIAMKFSGCRPLYEDTSVIGFEPHRSIPSAEHGPKVGHNELDCISVCKVVREISGCYRYVLFYNLVS